MKSLIVGKEEVLVEFEYHSEGYLIRGSTKEPVAVPHINGYRQIGWKGKTYLEHRLVFLIHHGYLPRIVDHIDRDKTNNRIDNLRDISIADNSVNTDATWGSSGRRGVSWSKKDRKYIAAISRRGNTFRLGYYTDLEEAAEAYRKARQQLLPGLYNE